ncbi:MAG: cell division protein FtsZ, partial [bacterium]
GILVNITGGPDLTLHEVNEASTIIREAADDEANIIFGAVIDERMTNHMKITVIATGFDRMIGSQPMPTRSYSIPSATVINQPSNTKPLDPRNGRDEARREDLDIPTFMRKKAD